jgi:hypothetical protein
MLKFQVDAKEWETKEWEPYAGPLPDSEEYKTEVARFDGCLKDSAPIQNRSQKG